MVASYDKYVHAATTAGYTFTDPVVERRFVEVLHFNISKAEELVMLSKDPERSDKDSLLRDGIATLDRAESMLLNRRDLIRPLTTIR